MEIKKVKPSLWLLLIPALVSAALIVVMVLSVGTISDVFAPMIEINPPGDSCYLEESGTYFIYQYLEDYESSPIMVQDQNGNKIPIDYTQIDSTLTVNGNSYELVGSFKVSTPGTYRIQTDYTRLSISKTSVGGMVGSIFALVGSILGLVFFNLVFLIFFFVFRSKNRRRIQMETYGTSGNYYGGYNPYYGNSGGYPPSYGR